jgi:hypothetical protein
VLANILDLAHNMDDDTPDHAQPPIAGPAPPIFAFVAVGRGSRSGQGQYPRGTCGGRGLPNKCSACGSLDHILSSCMAYDNAVLEWTLAKRKLIIQRYGTPAIGSASAHVTMLSDVPADDPDSLPTFEECTDEFDDTEISVPFTSVAFSFSLAPSRNLSQFWVVDSVCSIDLTAFRRDFVTFDSPSTPSRVGGVGNDVKGSGTVRMSVMLASGHLIRRTVHAWYTLDLSSRSTQRIGRLLNVIWMQSHNGCEFIFPPNFDIGLIVVPTEMGVLKPSGNGLHLLPLQPKLPQRPLADSPPRAGASVALTAKCDPVLWHCRFGHLHMQSLHAHHTHGVPTCPALANFVTNVSCDSCLLHKATVAARNITPCTKPSRPLLNFSYEIRGTVNVPSPHGLRYCLLVIDHRSHYM